MSSLCEQGRGRHRSAVRTIDGNGAGEGDLADLLGFGVEPHGGNGVELERFRQRSAHILEEG
jgi:hypothetical protein